MNIMGLKVLKDQSTVSADIIYIDSNPKHSGFTVLFVSLT